MFKKVIMIQMSSFIIRGSENRLNKDELFEYVMRSLFTIFLI